MALFTIVTTIRKRQHCFQVRADSVANAIRVWASDLDVSDVPNFGGLSKQRLQDALQQFGPNCIDGLEGVSEWHGAISGFDFAVVIVQTEVP